MKLKEIFYLTFLKKLQVRLLVLITFSIVFFVGLLLVFVSTIARNKLVESAETMVKSVSNEYACKIKTELEKSLTTSRTLAQSISKYQTVPEKDRRSIYNNMLISVLEQNEDYLCTWIACEPNAIDNLDSLHRIDELNIKGQYLKAFYRSHNEILTEDPSEESEIELDYVNYYVIPKRNKCETILEPYYYSYTGNKRDEVLETSAVVPIMTDGNFLGVVAVDIPLDFFQRISNQINLFDDGFGCLISYTGIFVSNPDKKMIGKNLNEFNAYIDKKYDILDQIQRKQNFSIICDLYNNGKQYFISFSSISIGNTKTPWSFMAVVPMENMLASTNYTVRLIYLLGFLSISFVVLIIYLASKNVVKPLRIIRESTAKLSGGDFSIETNKIGFEAGDEMQAIAHNLDVLVVGRQRTALFAHEIGKGNLHEHFIPMSDKDVLGLALLEMQKSLIHADKQETNRKIEEEKQNWKTEGLAKFGDILRRNIDNINELSYQIISQLVNYIEANQGGLFLYNDDDKSDVHLQLLSSYAYNRNRFISKKIAIGDGLIGTCALEKMVIYLTKIPEDYIEITSGMGTAPPSSLLIVPLVINEEIFGIIEIASFRTYQKYEIDFVERIAESIASTLLSAKINAKTQKLLIEFQHQSAIMAEKEKELRQNVDDLKLAHIAANNREALMKSILNGLDSSFLMAEFDLSGTLTTINDDYLTVLNLTRRIALGKNILEIIHADNKQIDEFDKMWNSLKTGNINKFSQKLTINNENVWLSQTYTPIFNEKNEVYKILNIASDITLSKRQEEKVQNLLVEAQDKAEQMAVQETEMLETMKELEELYKQTGEADREIQRLKSLNERLSKQIEMSQIQTEKRFNKSSQLELKLKSRIKELQDEIAKLKI